MKIKREFRQDIKKHSLVVRDFECKFSPFRIPNGLQKKRRTFLLLELSRRTEQRTSPAGREGSCSVISRVSAPLIPPSSAQRWEATIPSELAP